MTKERKNRDPTVTISQPVISFCHGIETEIMARRRVSVRERNLVLQAQQKLGGDTANYFSLLGGQEALPIAQARMAASIEAAAFLITYPRMMFELPTFPPLYRLVRTLELSLGLERGGDNLLVGSGITVPEVLAFYIEPPTREMVERVTGFDGEDLMEKAIHAVKLGIVTRPISYKEGVVTIVEPNLSFIEATHRLSNLYVMPEGKIHLAAATIGDVVRDNVFPGNANNVLWHRVEPNVYNGKHQAATNSSDRRTRRSLAREQERSLKVVLNYLLGKLKSEGRLIFTVGGGDNQEEFQARRDLIALAKDLLSKTPSGIVEELPLYFSGNPEEEFFGGLECGIVGCVIIKKK